MFVHEFKELCQQISQKTYDKGKRHFYIKVLYLVDDAKSSIFGC